MFLTRDKLLSNILVLAAQSSPTLCNPMDCSQPGSSVHGILQARVLEWVAIPFSRGSSQPRDWTRLGLLNCRHILYCLNHQGSPTLKPFPRSLFFLLPLSPLITLLPTHEAQLSSGYIHLTTPILHIHQIQKTLRSPNSWECWQKQTWSLNWGQFKKCYKNLLFGSQGKKKKSQVEIFIYWALLCKNINS